MRRARIVALATYSLLVAPGLARAQQPEPDPDAEELEELEELEPMDSIESIGVEDESVLDATFIVFTGTSSLFGSSATEVDGETERADFALVVERIRPTLTVSAGEWWSAEVAYDVIPLIGANPAAGGQSVGGLAVQGVGLSALRLVDADTELYASDSGWVVQQNIDRLNVRLGEVGREVTIGRQAFSHGSALMFPATDIFAPFGPGTINTEFKRGVDAVRGTFAINPDHELELFVIAHEPDVVLGADDARVDFEEWMYLLRWRGIFPGLFDVSLFGGTTYAQPTVGADVASSLFGATIYAEGMARFALGDDQDTSVQATAGFNAQWTSQLSLIGEVYYSSLGAEAPFARALTAPSLARQVGELNYFGNWYAGLTGSYARELVRGGVGYIQNLQDGSVLLTGNLGYDFAENVAVGLGALVPIGRRVRLEETQGLAGVQIPVIESEFGLFPTLLFADVQMTF
ncbi:MAG: hypothetical protein AAGI01_04010 [Myxococcota bacterium]